MELVLQQQLTIQMTHKLRQAIELLQYSTYELHQYIKEQQLENPLIELKEQENTPLYEKNSRKKSKLINTTQLTMDGMKCNEIGMRDKLFEQATLLFTDDQKQKILSYLIYNLDDNGYLNKSELVEYEPFTKDEIDRGIKLLQQIGPIGIGARSLKECLLLQVTDRFPEEKLVRCLIQNHLELLANRKWNELAIKMNISLAKVKEIYDSIQTLNPKPCSFISDFSIQYVTPDIIVEMKEPGISFYLNDHYLPSIQFNNDYSSFLTSKNETSKYINKHYTNYQWLLSSIEQRRQTISKIVNVIISKQESFFREGFSALNPLTLKEVAEEIEMHESTVSRATINKVIQTPKGTFDLRVFFTSKLETADGNSISQTKMKKLLESFIAQENKLKPVSDQKIANYFLEEKGITISRRTVSKYREELKIPSSNRRKEF